MIPLFFVALLMHNHNLKLKYPEKTHPINVNCDIITQGFKVTGKAAFNTCRCFAHHAILFGGSAGAVIYLKMYRWNLWVDNLR